MKYFAFTETGFLIPTFDLKADESKGKVLEDTQRYKIVTDSEHKNFLIFVGFDEHHRDCIYCTNMGELIHALALVRTAFPAKCKS